MVANHRRGTPVAPWEEFQGDRILPGAGRPEHPQAPSPGSRQQTGLRVLVADDYVETAQSTCALLESFGCTTAVAYDGAAALALVDVFLPQVVMLDIDMPILDGLAVARRIRSKPGGYQPLMLIAVTGKSGGMRHQALDAGFDAFVNKPVDTTWLEQGVEQWQSKAHGTQ